MGQLEKYGLYVLCLVIFLILGVAIWGEPASASPGQREDVVAMRVGGVGSAKVGSVVGSPNMAFGVNRNAFGAKPNSKPRVAVLDSLDELLQEDSESDVGGSQVSAPLGAKSAPKTPAVAVAKPKPAAVVAPKPKVVATRDYKVRNGDTLGAIALRQLGSTRYVQRIKAVNPGLTDRIKIGQTIKLPGKSTRSKPTAVLANSNRVYTIVSGDSFSKIAEVELGDETRYRELEDLNPNVNPNALRIGKKVKLPLK